MTAETTPHTDAAILDRLTGLIDQATSAGADAADAILVDSTSLSMARRLGQPESVERSESTDLGLRVFVGKRQAIVSSSDLTSGALDALVDRAVAMARSVPEDPHCGLATPDLLATAFPDLEQFDPGEPSPEALADLAQRAEDAARAVVGVTNSEGAEAGWARDRVAVAASNGFAHLRAATRHSLSVSVLAGEGTGMERDYDYDARVFAADLRPAEQIGRAAGEKAVRRLNPRKVGSAQVPVVFDPRVSRSLLGHLAGAVNGAAIARGTSFLKDRLEKPVFPAGVTIIDDPLRPRGLRSKSFDAEGVATARRQVIDDGVLTTWLLDLRSARQLGLHTTGNASRGVASPPSPSTTNFYLAAGQVAPRDLMADITGGLYVTELIGFGVNSVTGDYSRGATGFWIDGGEIAYPVSEITIAGNLVDMFAHLTAADDLEFRYGTDAPTVRIDGMTVAGQ
ncbi:MAG: TldD/PmbA family protein [Hyphomicrobiales bacterium]|nr:TldD/PmbA family protein [Hyphomicrobiales bacterium]